MSFPIYNKPLSHFKTVTLTIKPLNKYKKLNPFKKACAISYIINPSHCHLIERSNEAVVIGERGQDEGIVLLVDLQDGAHVQLGILKEKTND